MFISYKRANKDIVFKIKDDIEKNVGEKCWIDLDGIESDVEFANVIMKAINKADVFLFMYSQASLPCKMPCSLSGASKLPAKILL